MTRTTENIGPVQRLKQNKMKTRPPNENFSVAAGPFLATRSSTSLEVSYIIMYVDWFDCDVLGVGSRAGFRANAEGCSPAARAGARAAICRASFGMIGAVL